MNYCIRHSMWLVFFLLEQGHKIAKIIVILQDNHGAICLEKNRTLSYTREPSFFIKDKIDSKEVSVEWYPTDKIIADCLDKILLQM